MVKRHGPLYQPPLLSKTYAWVAMRFYRLAELFLRYSQKVGSGNHEHGIASVSGSAPLGDEPPAHWLEMARRQAPQLYRSVLSRRIAAAKKLLNREAAGRDVVADTQGTEVGEQSNQLPPVQAARRREEVLPRESREPPARQEEQHRTSSIDYEDGEPVKQIEPGGGCLPKRPANWLGQLRSRWHKAKAKAVHPSGALKPDAAFDAAWPDVDAVRTQGERPPSGIQHEHAASLGVRVGRQSDSRFTGVERERTQSQTQLRVKRANTPASQEALRANTPASQEALRTDALDDETVTALTPGDIQEIADADWFDAGSDAAMGSPAESHRPFAAKVDASGEKAMLELSSMLPTLTATGHELPPDMTTKPGLEAKRFPMPVSPEASSVEASCWAPLPDQVENESDALPWASLPDDAWTQPLRSAAIERAGLPGHELYGADEHKLSG